MRLIALLIMAGRRSGRRRAGRGKRRSARQHDEAAAGAQLVTTTEACNLVIQLVRELAGARAEAAALRKLQHAALEHAHTQYVELTRLRARYHTLLNQRRANRPVRAA